LQAKPAPPSWLFASETTAVKATPAKAPQLSATGYFSKHTIKESFDMRKLLASALPVAIILSGVWLSASVAYTDSAESLNSEMTQKKLDDIEKKLGDIEKNQSSFTNPSILLPFLSALLVAIIGGGIALHTQFGNRQDQTANRIAQEHVKTKELIFDSLKWFEGGIQKRSIGIAVVDANWKKYCALQDIWTSVLTSQAIYILSKSYVEKNGKYELLPSHERLNLKRILSLLQTASSKNRAALLSGDPFEQIPGEFDDALDKLEVAQREAARSQDVKEIKDYTDELKALKDSFKPARI